MIFDGDGDGKVYGNPTLETDAKIPAGKKLTIPQGIFEDFFNALKLSETYGIPDIVFDESYF